jgi:hypothetical protein
MTTSSKEVIKAKRAPEITPGLIRGKVILKKVTSGFAPRLKAAYSKLRSNTCREADMVISTIGIDITAWARTMV